MQICQDHWHELKNAIRQRGLWKLVSPETVGQPPLQSSRKPFLTRSLDPLDMASHLIGEQALRALGEYLDTRSYCPLCEVEQNLGQGLSMQWIDTDADTVLELFRSQHPASNT